MLAFMHSLCLIATMKACLFLPFYADFSSSEQERFISKMLPHLYLHHFNFTEETKSIVGKLDDDMSMESSDREGTRTQTVMFQSNPHLPYILPLPCLVHT